MFEKKFVPAEGKQITQSVSPYLPPSALMDEDAPEGWMFLDYQDDGRIFALALKDFEATYRPDPEDQG